MSIKWRLFGYLLIFTAIPLAIVWFFQIVFLENFYTFIKTQDVKSAVEMIAGNIENENLDLLIERIANQNDSSIRIYDMEGSVLYSSDFGPDNRIAELDAGQLAGYFNDAEQNGGFFIKMFDQQPMPEFTEAKFAGDVPPPSHRTGKTIVSAMIVPSSGGNRLVLMNTMITPVNATIRTLRVQLVYITLILIALSLLIALLMSQRISKPIIKTNTAANELAKGDYDIVFDARGYREIAELNHTLNYAASEMSKVERLRRELIANVSHDLRTPLTLITGYAEMLRDIPGENTPQNAQIIIDEASRLSMLVSDMMDISNLQAGAQELKITTFDLTQCVREILTRYAKLTEQDGYCISFDSEEDVLVSADYTRICQVVYNLINNAVNYTGNDLSVDVRQIVKDGFVRIEVQDTGEGIDERDIPYIWDRYYKVDKSHKRAAIGTGLGLSIVQSILKLHHADFGVESEKGNGSTFWFELKVEEDSADQ